MSIVICGGPVFLAGGIDKEGRRAWNVMFRVESTVEGTAFGPATALTAPGLPHVGDVWVYYGLGIDPLVLDEGDPFAFCTPEVKVEPIGVPATMYELTYTFVTEPRSGSCSDQTQAGPLLAPLEVTIHWENRTIEAVYDRHGNFLQSSSHEQFTGPQIEMEDADVIVEITRNVADSQIFLLTVLNNHLNSSEMWGLPPRWVKFNVDSLTPKVFGSCYKYYAQKLRFKCKKGGWDRPLRDVGTKCIRGFWQQDSSRRWDYIVDSPVDRNNPQDFIRYKDNTETPSKCVLDGFGKPWVPESVTEVNDCAFCNSGGGPTVPPSSASGAPAQWRLLNIFDSAGHAIILLQSLPGCNWGAEDEDGNLWSLITSGGTGTGAQWTLQVNNGSAMGGATWETDFGEPFFCNGTNVLASDAYIGTPAEWDFDAYIAPNSNERINDCDYCNASPVVQKKAPTAVGAPSKYRVGGLLTAAGEVVILTHTSGCTWSFFDGLDNWVLEYLESGSNRFWQLSLNGGTVQWIANEWSWKCRGPNAMATIGAPPAADPPWPKTVTLTAGNRPGVRTLELYDDAELVTLLRLPADIL